MTEELRQKAECFRKKYKQEIIDNDDFELLDKFDVNVEAGYIAGAEPREKRITELEKENTELKEALKNDKVCKCSHYLNFKDLEKENGELKHQLNKNPCVCNTEWYCNDCLERLTNAKQIISEYVRLANLEKEDTVAIWQLYHKAEQFLNSEVEK